MSAGISLVPLIVAAVMAVAGVVLVVWGVWPRRRGDTPHCRKCGYNLTGLTSDQCPECGAAVAAGGVVYGERRRRPVMAGIGVFVLVLMTPLVAIGLGKVDWYPWAPTSLLTMRVQSADRVTATRAWKELDRRIKANALSDGQHGRLIELALKEQAAAQVGPVGQQMVDYLGDCFLNKRLSNEQERLFFDQYIVLDLRVRPKIGPSDRLGFRVTEKTRGPSSGFSAYARWDFSDFILDRRDPEVGYVEYMSSGAGVGSSSAWTKTKSVSDGWILFYPEHMSVGRHKLVFPAEIEIEYTGPRSSAGIVIPRRRLRLEATFEVVATKPPEHIRLIKDPSLRSALQAAIVPELQCLAEGGNFKNADYELATDVRIRPRPVDVAFDVIIRIDGKEYPYGGIAVSRDGLPLRYDEMCGEEAVEKVVRPEPGKLVDIILRSSEKVARETVDLYEIWDGELVFENVPVKLVPVIRTSNSD